MSKRDTEKINICWLLMMMPEKRYIYDAKIAGKVRGCGVTNKTMV